MRQDELDNIKKIAADRKDAERRRSDEWYSKHDSEAPSHLSERSKALWAKVVPVEIRCEERKALLSTALEALDRAEAARKAVDVDGMTIRTGHSGVMHVHPLLKVERDARTQFAAIWKYLDFHHRDIAKPSWV